MGRDGPRALQIAAWVAAGVLVFAAVAGLGYAVLHAVPDTLGHTEGLDDAAAAAERGRVRTAALAYLAGVVTATGAVFTGLTFRLSRRGQATDRFSRAVEQLGHPTVDVRLGGIHALGALARDSRTYHGPVVEVLSAYVREHAKATADGAGAPADVKSAMAILARRRLAYDAAPPELDFAGANLGAINLEGAQLRQARFSHACLRDARLARADLRDANLIEADLRDADFGAADLSGAMLNSARLDGALLERAKGLAKRLAGGRRL